LNQYGNYLKENQPVVIVGKLSLRDDKEPQIIVNRARPISDYAQEIPEEVPAKALQGTLYLKLETEDAVFSKVRAMVNMFPGENPVVVYFADTKQRRGAKCALDSRLVDELTNLLGQGNVVVK
jgi:DNA polymerase-3 subunit alpha